MTEVTVPRDVDRILDACIAAEIDLREIMKRSAEDSAEFAATLGMSFGEFLGAIDWLAGYMHSRAPGPRH